MKLIETNTTPKMFLTTQQIATLLGIATRTVCLWAECGELPAIKVGRQWRFRRDTLIEWLSIRESNQLSDHGMRNSSNCGGATPKYSSQAR